MVSILLDDLLLLLLLPLFLLLLLLLLSGTLPKFSTLGPLVTNRGILSVKSLNYCQKYMAARILVHCIGENSRFSFTLCI